jgi:cytohesin
MFKQIAFGTLLFAIVMVCAARADDALNQQLFAAVKAGDKATVEALIAKGADVNAKDKYGQTPLYIAGTSDVADLLIDHGALINAKDSYDRTPLHITAWSGKKDVAELLIAKGADVNARDKGGQTPLYLAGTKEMAELLVMKGANVNARDMSGNTPLLGTASGHLDIVELLIAKGADVNLINEYSGTVLHSAAGNGNKDVVELLIAKGLDVNAKDKGGRTPLHLAKNKDVAELLIAKGADVNAKSNDGTTPLSNAISQGKTDVAEVLISKGADVNPNNNGHATVLHLAVSYKNKDVAQLLIAKGTDINARDWQGDTPLIYAVLYKARDMAEILLDKGADINAKGQYGETALQRSIEAKQKDMVELLIAKGADVNAKDTNGDTALDDAIRHYDRDIVELLIAKGANVNAKNNNGYTPLYGANTRDAAELLIAKGADVNAKTQYNTLLEMVVQNNLMEVAELLIAKGADVNAKSPSGGMTPLFAAARFEKADMAELLISKGADVNAKDPWGNMPIDTAIGWGSEEVIKRLIAAGADLSPNETIQFHKTLLEEANSATTKNKEAVIAILQAAMIKKAGNPDMFLQQQLASFKGHSGNEDLRKSIIDLTLKMRPAPVVPAEAEAAAGRGAYIFKNANSMDDKLSSAKEYLAAIELAPWVANYYYNLCTVLEKTPYTQQALHACKLYLIAAPNAADAGDMRQRIAGLQYALDKDKTQMKGRTTFLTRNGESPMDNMYRIGGISGDVSGNDIALKLIVNWYAGPPKYQIYIGCFDGNEILGDMYDLVSTDRWEGMCKSNINLHLVIRPEGEGFVEVSSPSGGSLRATLDDLFNAKQKAMEHALMSSAFDDKAKKHFYVVYLQGGINDHYAGYATYESTCNGSLLKQDPRALPNDFISFEESKAVHSNNIDEVMKFSTRFAPELNKDLPPTYLCTSQFADKTGYYFGEME